MAAPNSNNVRYLVLLFLHIVFAGFLLILSFLFHGRIPGFSADESAALGFVLFVGLGLPLLLIVITMWVVSVFTDGRYVNILMISMLATFVFAVFSVWAGIGASLAYLAFTWRTLVQELRRSAQLKSESQRESI